MCLTLLLPVEAAEAYAHAPTARQLAFDRASGRVKPSLKNRDPTISPMTTT
jgi:hypothetical protein